MLEIRRAVTEFIDLGNVPESSVTTADRAISMKKAALDLLIQADAEGKLGSVLLDLIQKGEVKVLKGTAQQAAGFFTDYFDPKPQRYAPLTIGTPSAN